MRVELRIGVEASRNHRFYRPQGPRRCHGRPGSTCQLVPLARCHSLRFLVWAAALRRLTIEDGSALPLRLGPLGRWSLAGIGEGAPLAANPGFCRWVTECHGTRFFILGEECRLYSSMLHAGCCTVRIPRTLSFSKATLFSFTSY